MPTTFGYTSIGASSEWGFAADHVLGGMFTLTEAGDITKISGYIEPRNNGMYGKAAIYSVVGGAPSALLAQSNPVALQNNTTWAWVDFPLTYSAIAGDYALIIFVDEGFAIRYDAGANGIFDLVTYPNFNNPFGAYTTLTGQKQSVYATYTPVGAAGLDVTSKMYLVFP